VAERRLAQSVSDTCAETAVAEAAGAHPERARRLVVEPRRRAVAGLEPGVEDRPPTAESAPQPLRAVCERVLLGRQADATAELALQMGRREPDRLREVGKRQGLALGRVEDLACFGDGAFDRRHIVGPAALAGTKSGDAGSVSFSEKLNVLGTRAAGRARRATIDARRLDREHEAAVGRAVALAHRAPARGSDVFAVVTFFWVEGHLDFGQSGYGIRLHRPRRR
jgi:hypothetical protein